MSDVMTPEPTQPSKTRPERLGVFDLVQAQQVDLGDHFRFAVGRTAKLDQLLEGAAVRYHVLAYLAGRRFEELIVDVGFGDPPVGEPEKS